MSLKQWQQCIKPENQLIVQASTMDGQDGQTAASIGMAYGYVHQNGNSVACQIGKHENLVLCAISEVTDQRRRGHTPLCRAAFISTLQKNGIKNYSISSAEYYVMLPTYKFVISPEGNGIDCHRHYEALMAGCIPIIEDNPIIRAKYGNVPILWTHDYSEITPEYLQAKYEEMLNKEWDFSKLFIGWWSPEEQQLIRIRGNFWCERLTGKKWY